MQARFLVGFLGFLSVAVLFVLIHFYRDAISKYILPEVAPYELATEQQSNIQMQPGWIGRGSQRGDVSYIFPATEMQVRLMFSDSIKRDAREIFRVNVGVVDDYQFFCINQVLTSHRIEYSYYKIGDSVWLVVASPNETILRGILEQLRHYDIDYTISKA